MDIKVMTFNIQHCLIYKKNKIDFLPFAEEILNSGAGIIGLNEVRDKGKDKNYEAQPEILSSLTGFNFYFAKAIDVKGENPYGNALLSKYPIVSAETVMIPDPKKKAGKDFETRCILHAEINAGERLDVFVTHMGLNRTERENAVKKLLEIIPEEKSILMGDFNCEPESDVLSPLFKKFNCDDIEEKTFPSYEPKIKIDYIFFTRDLELIWAETSKNVLSDHLSHTARFLIRGKK